MVFGDRVCFCHHFGIEVEFLPHSLDGDDEKLRCIFESVYLSCLLRSDHYILLIVLEEYYLRVDFE